MSRPISWNFYKITLQQDVSFDDRREVLVERFRNADTYVRNWRDVEYKYQLYDVERQTTGNTERDVVLGRMTRIPKTAYGRALDRQTRQSEETSVSVVEIADSTEFIYDLESCVLSLHRRAPFTSVRPTAVAWAQLLGMPHDSEIPEETDVHVECLRDEAYTDEVLNTDEPLREVKLTFAKPNPGSGLDILAEIHLGLIGEETDSDEVSIDAKKRSGGTLKKTGFIRRSIRVLLGNGYLKKGSLLIGDKKHDLLAAKEKDRETEGFAKDEDGSFLILPEQADLWFEQLVRENNDIFP